MRFCVSVCGRVACGPDSLRQWGRRLKRNTCRARRSTQGNRKHFFFITHRDESELAEEAPVLQLGNDSAVDLGETVRCEHDHRPVHDEENLAAHVAILEHCFVGQEHVRPAKEEAAVVFAVVVEKRKERVRFSGPKAASGVRRCWNQQAIADGKEG